MGSLSVPAPAVILPPAQIATLIDSAVPADLQRDSILDFVTYSDFFLSIQNLDFTVAGSNLLFNFRAGGANISGGLHSARSAVASALSVAPSGAENVDSCIVGVPGATALGIDNALYMHFRRARFNSNDVRFFSNAGDYTSGTSLFNSTVTSGLLRGGTPDGFRIFPLSGSINSAHILLRAWRR